MTQFASPMARAVLLAVIMTVLAVATTAAQVPDRTVVSAAGYPDGVRLVEADERAFLDPASAGIAASSEPERLEVAPAAFVPRVEVRSALWARLAAGAALSPVETVADYDSQAATVRLRHLDGTVSWWALDAARASMLTRYTRIGRGGRTGAEPSTLQVLREMRRWRESVVIDVEGFEIEPRRWDQRLLWNEFERAIALDVTPGDVLPVAVPGVPEPRFFVGESPRDGIESFDLALAALDHAGGIEVTFRLLDGRALPFVYLPGPSLLVDVTRLEAEPTARAATLPAFEVSPSVAITLERLVATEGAPLADGANERLADGGDGVPAPAPRPSSGVAVVASPPPPPPTPRVVRSFNEAAAVMVRNVEPDAPMFVVALLTVLAGSVVAGARFGRRASR